MPVEGPEASAEFLLRQVLGVDRAKYFTMLDTKVRPLQEKKYRRYIARRKKHEPVWQIVGKVEFWGMDFFVNQDVLVPRPETELLVEKVLKTVARIKYQVSNVLDIGTGAGPIAVVLARELLLDRHSELVSESQRSRNKFGMTKVIATDISKEALKIAKKNAKANGVDDVIDFIQADLFKPVANSKKLIAGKFDVVTANLPYIPHGDLGGLALEIHHYEPRVSLDGGAGGLIIYEKFLKELPNHINLGGTVFCEIGKDQGQRFCAIASKCLPKASCKIVKDLAGIDRIAVIQSE